MDIVYLLGRGTCCNYCELKYSLRSLEANLTDYNNVFIIGEKPFFLSEKVTVIPYQDIHKNKARNIMNKVYRAAIDERISSDFMVWNDDYFLLKKTSAHNYPFYYKNTIPEAIQRNIGEYEKHLTQTFNVLRAHGLPVLNFDSHYPIIYNKEKFLDMVARYDWEVPFGMVLKSMYCNTHKIQGEFLLDCKISHPYNIKQINALNKDRHLFSIADAAYNIYMKRFLNDLFPQKSKYET